MNLKAELERRVRAALAACGAPEGSPAIVASAARAELGDYQANGVMPAAKAMGVRPRELAAKVVAQLGAGGAGDLSELADPPTVAGPGFINIRLKAEWLGRQLAAAGKDEHLGVEQAGGKGRQTVVVDYSGPNLAKEMHVGHLRSTIIGDALARVLEFCGHKVVRQNHMGDWGTQFGMLIANMPKLADLWDLRLSDLEAYYVEAKRRFDSDAAFADCARAVVAELHRVGPNAWKTSDAVLRWRNYRQATLEHCYQVYGRLGVWFTPNEFRPKWQPDGPGEVPFDLAPPEQTGIVGESFYNADLPKVVEELRETLRAQGLFRESQGAQCVFLPEFKDRDGNELPLIVQKSDEGFLYATTDLAAIRYRVGTLKADRVLYVTDSRQGLHFRQVFAVARAAKFAPPEVSLEHVAFGMMLGADGKPFRTREGGTVKLMALLDEAERRALELVSAKNPDMDGTRREEIACVVGIGAVKYADLAQNRTSDYVFSWDKLLSLEGNTAPYMQYAYARIRSIFRKDATARPGAIQIADPAERALALRLARFAETVAAVAAECLPNVLCAYLYDLAGAFMGFYESCPVLQSEGATRASRLGLCELTARTIQTGLGLLGIQTLEQM